MFNSIWEKITKKRNSSREGDENRRGTGRRRFKRGPKKENGRNAMGQEEKETKKRLQRWRNRKEGRRNRRESSRDDEDEDEHYKRPYQRKDKEN